jgi:hypothetical protein
MFKVGAPRLGQLRQATRPQAVAKDGSSSLSKCWRYRAELKYCSDTLIALDEAQWSAHTATIHSAHAAQSSGESSGLLFSRKFELT